MSSDYTLYEQMYLRWIRAGMPCWLQIECRLLHSNAMISDGKHGLYGTATVNTCLINRYTLGICIFDWKAKSRWGNDKRHIRIENSTLKRHPVLLRRHIHLQSVSVNGFIFETISKSIWLLRCMLDKHSPDIIYLVSYGKQFASVIRKIVDMLHKHKHTYNSILKLPRLENIVYRLPLADRLSTIAIWIPNTKPFDKLGVFSCNAMICTFFLFLFPCADPD